MTTCYIKLLFPNLLIYQATMFRPRNKTRTQIIFVKYTSNHLVVPCFKLSTIGCQNFTVAATKIWNAPDDNVVSASFIDSFRNQLNTFLFQRSYSC